MSLPLSKLKGLGPARKKALEDAGIRDTTDLLYFFPRRYVDRTLSDSALLRIGEEVTLLVEVQNRYMAYGRRSRLIARCRTLQGEPLSLVWFKGSAYIQRQFEDGDTLVVSGKLDSYRGLQIVHPDFERLDPGEETELLHAGRIIPIYKGSEALKKQKIDSRTFRRWIHQIFEKAESVEDDPLPKALREEKGLLPYPDSLKNIHFPASDELLKKARRSLIFEELYLYTLLLYHRALLRKREPRRLHPLPLGESPGFSELIESLPFSLTGEQERAIQKMLSDASRPTANAYLLQGDVGSGKTLVALALALHYMDAGIQVALLAPTEVLARQHFLTISEMLGFSYQHRMELFLGKGRAKQKRETLDRLATGDTTLVIGTHSLLEDSVRFERLGLVVIDEQHRFGVEQRERLRSKGENPDLLTMTATPIPRSLCLTEFSDLELVTLKEKPAGRKPIKTMWLREDRRAAMYQSIRKHVALGRQGYIVYPLIQESEKLDLRAAEDAFAELATSVFPDLRLALLHGRLKSAEKEDIMRRFREGALDLLVTTTVIEVGVDVPNANMMIIEHAERFGISQLHQLRGRVGRGTEESYCVLMSDADNPEAVERLNALVDSDDGFYLAEVDLKLRGPGELLGLRQHGLSDLRLADLVRDRPVVEEAFAAARSYPEATKAAIEHIQRRFSEGLKIFPAS